MITKTNFKLWRNYELFARSRGRLVASMLSERINLAGAAILDFGCGAGGVSLELAAAGAHVTAFDVNQNKLDQLRRAVEQTPLKPQIVDSQPRDKDYFDAIVLSDVIEHLVYPGNVLRLLNSILKPGGVLYLSTPNRLSPINVICDPHFSLPFVSLLSRKQVRFITSNLLHWQPKKRIDFPQLFSLPQLYKLLKSSGFAIKLANRTAAQYAFQHPESIWNRNLHLQLVGLLKKTGMVKAVEKIISDDPDFFNVWLNPTWYLFAQKSPTLKGVGL